VNQKNKAKIFLSFFVLFFLYFFSRLQHLTAIPVFADEAIYIRWAQVIRNVETLRFIPLTDGKQPLFMWLLAFGPLQFVKNPLVAGRLISVFAGFFTTIFLSISVCLVKSFSHQSKNPLDFIAFALKKHTSLFLLSSLLYIFLPFFFFFDRLALPDNLLSTFTLLSFVISLLLAKFPRLDLSLILGAILGLAWLTKSPAIYFLVLSLATFFVLNFSQIKKSIFPLISLTLAFLIYNTLRLGPQFHMIALRNKDYVWPLYQILRHPFDPLIPHLKDIISIFTSYLGLPLLFLFFFSLFYHKTKIKKISLITFLWFLLPLTATAIFAKVFTARYVLFTLPFLLIIISLNLSKLPRLLIFLPLLFNLIFIYKISFQPFSQSLPSTETGYLTDWTAGWGIKEASDYLISRSQTANVIVGTEGNFGTLPDGLQIYTDSLPRLTIIGQGLGFTKVPPQLLDAKNHGDEVYLLINRSRLTIPDYNSFTILKQYPKPDGDQLLLLKI